MRDRLGETDRVALERSLEPQVIIGMVAHDVQDPALRLSRIVQVGEGVAKAGG